MPLTTTLEQIKAHQLLVEKDKITPHNLPACLRCGVDSALFKLHAFRERRFLVIVEMLIQAAFCTLVRFRCIGCGKTFTDYPDFVIPHKHYTRPTIMGFAGAYVESEKMTYEQALMVDKNVPGYRGSERTLAASTIYRWVTTIGGLIQTRQKSLALLLQQNPISSVCHHLAHLVISKRKYKTRRRKALLLDCFRMLITEAFFLTTFKTSIFTKLAIGCAFS
jgi:hypothetical protein